MSVVFYHDSEEAFRSPFFFGLGLHMSLRTYLWPVFGMGDTGYNNWIVTTC